MNIVRYLVEQGVNIEKFDAGDFDDVGWAPLMSAAAKGHMDIVRYLVEQGANMETADEYDYAPLKIACEYGHLDVVRYKNKGQTRKKSLSAA